MFELNAYDADSFETGVWSTVQGDSELKVARAGNAEYERQREKLEKEFRREHGDKMSPEARHAMSCMAIARGLLKDWKNVTENGKPVDYTPEIGARYLKKNPKLLSYVLDRANDLERWEREDTEDQQGKPVDSSDGKPASSAKAKA